MPPREKISRDKLRDLAECSKILKDASKELRMLRKLYDEKRSDLQRRLVNGAD